MKCRSRSALSIKFHSDFSSNQDKKKKSSTQFLVIRKGEPLFLQKRLSTALLRALAFSRHS